MSDINIIQFKDFPIEIKEAMLNHQFAQGNIRDIHIFEKSLLYDKNHGGFSWFKTIEGTEFWNEVIKKSNFNIFFEKYPKKERFPKIGDTVVLKKSVGWNPSGLMDSYIGQKVIITHINNNCIIFKNCCSWSFHINSIDYYINAEDEAETETSDSTTFKDFVNKEKESDKNKIYEIDYISNPKNKIAIHIESGEEARICDAIMKGNKKCIFNPHSYWYSNLSFEIERGIEYPSSHSSIKYYKSQNYTIIKATDFINYHKLNKNENGKNSIDSETIIESDRLRYATSSEREELRRCVSGFEKSYRRQGIRIEEVHGAGRYES